MKSLILAIVGLAAGVGVARADLVAFDSITGQTVLAVPSGGGSTTSTGNRTLGQAITLATSVVSTTPTITGFDLTLLNNTGAAITLQSLQLHYFVWGTWTPGNGTAAVPAFSNSLGSGTVDFTLPAGGFAFSANNTFAWITGSGAQAAGTGPGVAITPIAVPDATQPIGVAFQWWGSTTVGGTPAPIGGLTSVLTGGTGALAPSVGTNAFGLPGSTQGYYRSASGETDGNFLQSSARNIGANSNLLSRVWAVPAPSAAGLLGLGGIFAARRRRA